MSKQAISADDATTIVSWAIAIRDTLKAEGIDPVPLFKHAELDMSKLNDASARYPLNNMSRLWRLCVQASGDPAFALKVPQHVRPNTLHGLGIAILTSRTLRDAVQRAKRYSAIITSAAYIRDLEFDNKVRIEVVSLPEVTNEAIEAMASTFFIMLRSLLDQTGETYESTVYFPGPRPKNIQSYVELLGENLQFDAGYCALIIEASIYDRLLPLSNPAIAMANDAVVQQYLSSFEDAVLLEARRAVVEELAAGIPSINDVAARLGKNPRALSRQLTERGITFSELREEVQCSFAKSLLADKNITLMEATFRLGFSDQSNFSKAFKRWTGKSPGKYRADHPDSL